MLACLSTHRPQKEAALDKSLWQGRYRDHSIHDDAKCVAYGAGSPPVQELLWCLSSDGEGEVRGRFGGGGKGCVLHV